MTVENVKIQKYKPTIGEDDGTIVMGTEIEASQCQGCGGGSNCGSCSGGNCGSGGPGGNCQGACSGCREKA